MARAGYTEVSDAFLSSTFRCAEDLKSARAEIEALHARLAEVEGERGRANELLTAAIEDYNGALSRTTSAERLVERAFRDGVTYGTNVEVVDVDLAWETSAVARSLTERRDAE